MRKKTYPLYKLTKIPQTGYDAAHGFVVRATSEHQARYIAARNAGDEGENTWLDPRGSSCEIIGRSIATTEECGVILRDFNAA